MVLTLTSTPLQLAEQALAMVPTSPELAVRLAQDALARAQREPEAAVVAGRALGLAAVEAGDVRAAAIVLRRAVRRGERAHVLVRTAEARMTLALALAYGGDARGALRELDRARGVLSGVEAARLEMQRAVVLHKLDRPDAALAGYRRALTEFRRHGDRLWEGRLLCNRGILRGERAEFVASRTDLERAERLFREDGRTLLVAQMRQNLGWLEARVGNVPLAFRHYDGAEAAFHEAGAITGSLRLDRGALLMSVGLVADARAELALAVQELAGGGMDADRAEAQVLFAEAALLDGDLEASQRAARAAKRAFAAQGRQRWHTLARLTLLRGATGDVRRRASALADELEAAGWANAAVDARLIGARSALAAGRPRAARDELRLAGRRARYAPFDVRAAAWHAEALLRLQEGNPRGAGRAVEAGLRAVEERRATLGATELRVHAARHGAPLAALGIRLALQTGRGQRVLVAAERARAAALHFPPVLPPRDARLAAALAELRGTSAAIEDAILDGGGPSPALLGRRAALERDIRARARHSAAGEIDAGLTLDDLHAVLGDRRLVELVPLAGTLHAVDVQGGQATLREAGSLDEIEADGRLIAFALHREAFGVGTAKLAREATRAAERLDRRLLGPGREGELVIVPTGALHALPWSALPSCAGRSVSIAPSAALWLRAAREASFAAVEECALVAGPGLAHADAEIAELAGVYPAATALTGEQATVGATLAAIRGAPQAHIAAHGTFRADNPHFSSLRLHDGALTVFDLESLSEPPQRIVLTACDAGRTEVSEGDELRGVVAALLALGTRTVIASLLPVPDEGAFAVARVLHAELRRGAAPAAALARAIADAPPGCTGFACFGAG